MYPNTRTVFRLYSNHCCTAQARPLSSKQDFFVILRDINPPMSSFVARKKCTQQTKRRASSWKCRSKLRMYYYDVLPVKRRFNEICHWTGAVVTPMCILCIMVAAWIIFILDDLNDGKAVCHRRSFHRTIKVVLLIRFCSMHYHQSVFHHCYLSALKVKFDV